MASPNNQVAAAVRDENGVEGMVQFVLEPPINQTTIRMAYSVQHPRVGALAIGGEELAAFCHTAEQRTVLAQPGRPVVFVRNRLNADQLFSGRPSYINALLIQSRGERADEPCSLCRAAIERDNDGLANPFPACVRLPGH
ncbi:hypothetical protein UCRPA7_6327 [Phaeoacremonium minimum UCRPA7]|uniref:Uncharacterized protein n=1 Tax=Phaeoacremonium minimum (strain UCR-PA7) TaxID=1286976 RepID=R8BFU5_PHAM7|nr:hypothetical protein UCRPA7_6327 [Phaeoacremonium minimum UCRPA7]EON98159.1 hypothetical protein UCRPA7_6327 [Phaeoacremonium minimum UCRPA7]